MLLHACCTLTIVRFDSAEHGFPPKKSTMNPLWSKTKMTVIKKRMDTCSVKCRSLALQRWTVVVVVVVDASTVWAALLALPAAEEAPAPAHACSAVKALAAWSSHLVCANCKMPLWSFAAMSLSCVGPWPNKMSHAKPRCPTPNLGGGVLFVAQFCPGHLQHDVVDNRWAVADTNSQRDGAQHSLPFWSILLWTFNWLVPLWDERVWWRALWLGIYQKHLVKRWAWLERSKAFWTTTSLCWKVKQNKAQSTHCLLRLSKCCCCTCCTCCFSGKTVVVWRMQMSLCCAHFV